MLKVGRTLKAMGAKSTKPSACESIKVMLKSERAGVSSSSVTSMGIEAPSAGVKNCPIAEIIKVNK